MVFWLMFLTRNLCKDKKNFHSCTIKLILYNSAVFRCCDLASVLLSQMTEVFHEAVSDDVWGVVA